MFTHSTFRIACTAILWLAAPAGLAADNDAHGPDNAAAGAPSKLASTSATAHKAGEIVIEPATIAISANEKLDYELGTLYVPENRAEPTSRIISIGFARFKAAQPGNAPPTFHLPGGPGFSYITSLKGMIGHFMRYRHIGDVVLIDQRGYSDRGEILRFSHHSADEPLDQPGTLAASTAAFVEMSKAAVADCAKKGIDLRGYTVKACVEDLNDLRKALGYDKISLVGISYGSQWSFATMRLHPEIVARALLSGVEPLDMGYDMPSGVFAAIQRYWKEAEKDKQLQPYIPAGGIEAAAKAVAKRFDNGPLKVTVKDKNGDVTIALGKEDFQRDFMHKAGDGPAFVLSLYHEHYDAWAKSVTARRRGHTADQKIIGPCIDTSLGVTPGREKRLRADPMTEYLGQWNWDAYIAAKDVWPSEDVGDDFRTPVETQIPVVFLEGDWDTQTPVENTLEISKSFTNSRVLIGEHGGHGILEAVGSRYPKEWSEIMNFLQSGTLPTLPERVSLPLPKFTVPDFPSPTQK
jgi:pimeloyl-ACP methyl ester carboxylesterase